MFTSGLLACRSRTSTGWNSSIATIDRALSSISIRHIWGSEDDYGKELFGRDQFEAIAVRLGQLKGKFVMSINNVPETREIFEGFDMLEVAVNYSVSAGKGVPARELLVSK